MRAHEYAAADFPDGGYAENHPDTALPRFPDSLVADFLTELASPDAPASTTVLNGTAYSTALFSASGGTGYEALFPAPFFRDLLTEMASALGETFDGVSLTLDGHEYVLADLTDDYGWNATHADTGETMFPDSLLGDFLAVFIPAALGAETFTRAGAGAFVENDGADNLSIATAATNVKRSAHNVYDTNGVLRECTLLEMSRTNITAISEPTVAQLSFSTPGVTDDPSGTRGFDRWLAVASGTGIRERVEISHGNLSAQAGQTYCASYYVLMADDGLGAPLHTGSTGATSDLTIIVQGLVVTDNLRVEDLGGRLYRVSGTRVVDSSTNAILGARRDTGNRQRDFRVIGFQVELASVPSSYVKTAGSTLTRAVDVLYYPSDGDATHPLETAQKSWFYCKFVEGGTVREVNTRLFQVGDEANTDPRMLVHGNGTVYRAFVDRGATLVSSALTTAPAIDDLVEILVEFFEDGAIQIHQRLNGVTLESGAKSPAAVALFTDWSAPRIWINGVGATAPGRNMFIENGNGELVTIGRGLPGGSDATATEKMDWAAARHAYEAAA